MIYTSYFAKLKDLPPTIIPVSICGKAPAWFTGIQYKKLAPKYSFFMKWKENHDNDYYTKHFHEEVLGNLDVLSVLNEISLLLPSEIRGNGSTEIWENPDLSIALICYEKPRDFCHRHLVADWLNKNGVNCTEYGCEWKGEDRLMPHDSLGDRMKEYENAYRLYLPKRLPVVVRVDGKAFHTFTRGFKRPFDSAMFESMKETAIELCCNVEGCKLAYTQSDEISLVLRNDDELTTQAWFNNNLQKIASVTASIATRAFNRAYRIYIQEHYMVQNQLYSRNIDQALFDSRAFLLPECEVVNYLIWRQQDSVRNSIESCARSLYSHKELFKKSCSEMLQMMQDKGFDWHELPVFQKSGLCIVRRTYKVNGAQRSKWTPDLDIPIFSEARDYIINEVWGAKKHEQV